MSHTSKRSVHRIAIAAAALIGAAMSCISTTVAHAEPTNAEPKHRVDNASQRFEATAEDYNAANSELEALEARHHTESAHQRDRDDARAVDDELGAENADTAQAGSTGSDGEAPGIPGGTDAAAATALQFAYDQIDKPYKWGAAGPDAYDCSGLTSAAWAEAGVDLPHNAAEQSEAVAKVSRDELQQGDLVFYYEDVRHVALFAGEGKVIHAPTPGESVKIAGIDDMPVQGYGRPS